MAEPSKRQRLASARFTEVAVALEAYFDGLHNGDVDRFKEVWHPEGHLYWISPEGDLVDRNAEQFIAYVEENKKSPHLAEYDQIIRLDFASDRCCCAKLQIALCAEHGERRYTDLLLLLRLHGKWQIISKVFSSVPLTELSHEERQDDLPFAVGEPVRGVLEYYRGGHLSRPEIIKENFHSSARLTFSNDSEELVCWSQQQFFEVIRGMPPTFADSNALRFDKILGVDKAGPDVAMIKLQIGRCVALVEEEVGPQKHGDMRLKTVEVRRQITEGFQGSSISQPKNTHSNPVFGFPEPQIESEKGMGYIVQASRVHGKNLIGKAKMDDESFYPRGISF